MLFNDRYGTLRARVLLKLLGFLTAAERYENNRISDDTSQRGFQQMSDGLCAADKEALLASSGLSADQHSQNRQTSHKTTKTTMQNVRPRVYLNQLV